MLNKENTIKRSKNLQMRVTRKRKGWIDLIFFFFLLKCRCVGFNKIYLSQKNIEWNKRDNYSGFMQEPCLSH